MNAELAQLRDIHLPTPIHMWPVAYGWLILYAITAVLLGYAALRYYIRYQQRSAVKYALLRLQQLEALTADNPSNINIAAEISTLLRRTALYYFNRNDIAGLTGRDWLNFLNQSGNTTLFSGESGRLLIDAPYRPNAHDDLQPLIQLSHQWLSAIAKKKPLPREK